MRQSKELLGQTRIEVDVARDQVQQTVTAAWSQYKAAVEQVSANRELVAANQPTIIGSGAVDYSVTRNRMRGGSIIVAAGLT